MTALRGVPLVIAAALLLSTFGCGDNEEPSPSATATSSPEESATPNRSAAPSPTAEPFQGGREPVEATPAPGGLRTALLRDVRTADQTNIDRITFELEAGIPGFSVEYVDPPIIADASGLEVEIEGSAFIQIRMEPADGHDPDTGDETYIGPLELKPNLSSLLEAERTGDFEGVLTWVLGLREETDFRVSTLEDPPSLVIDVAHP